MFELVNQQPTFSLDLYVEMLKFMVICYKHKTLANVNLRMSLGSYLTSVILCWSQVRNIFMMMSCNVTLINFDDTPRPTF